MSKGKDILQFRRRLLSSFSGHVASRRVGLKNLVPDVSNYLPNDIASY